MGLYILGTGVLAEELCALAEDMNRPVEAFIAGVTTLGTKPFGVTCPPWSCQFL